MPQPWGSRTLEQWIGQEVLWQSRKSEWDRTVPGKLIGAERELQNDTEALSLMLSRRGNGDSLFPIIFDPIQGLALSRQPLPRRSSEDTGPGVVRLLRSGRRRSGVSR